jgi:putative FmdB family regulatory protein
MPLFEYLCRECSHQFETLVRGSETPACPACHTTALERRMSTFAAHSRDGGSMPKRVESFSPCGSCGDPRGPGACSMN